MPDGYNPAMSDEKKPEEGAKKNEFVEETPVVTQHEVVLGGKTIKYSVTAGRMPLKNAKDEIEAQVFYTNPQRILTPRINK